MSDGDPGKPKEPAQGTLLGFPQPREPEPPARKHALPPPRSQRPSAAPPLAHVAPPPPPVEAPPQFPLASNAPAAPQFPVASNAAHPEPVPQPLPSAHSAPTAPHPDYASGPTGTPPRYETLPNSGPREWAAPESGGVGAVLGAVIEEVPGSKFVSFLKISARRAFRLRIEPTEVLPAEREALERASPPIVDPNLQAFLAWRRSVLFLVAVALVPLAVTGLLDVLIARMATPIRVVKIAPVLAELVFLAICWSQLRHWAHWRRQRRWLLLGWLLFMLTPFVAFVYPLQGVAKNYSDLKALGIAGIGQVVIPFQMAMLAMLQLAPKAISLMPGLIRASLVIKLLFPGSTGPGWLIVVAAPIYALLVYVILIVPYQFTGSGWFVAGIIGVVAAQAMLARAGFALAAPHTELEALYHVKRVRTVYVVTMIVSAILIVIALGSLVAQLRMPWLDVVLGILKFETNVLILTLIGSDLVITNLDKARVKTEGRDHVEEAAELKIAAFVSLDAPHVPPPPGPAPTTFTE